MKTILVSPERCIGCRQCEFACAVEHSAGRDPLLAAWEEPLPRPRIHVQAGPRANTSFPVTCRHCDPAPCEQVCPTGALRRDATTSRIVVDGVKCIDCATCAMVCPFDALTFHVAANGHPPREVAVKCDACPDRLARGLEPACVEVCKVDALAFGEVNDLVEAGRIRQSVALLAAAAASGTNEAPSTVAGWRAWGEQATRVAVGSER